MQKHQLLGSNKLDLNNSNGAKSEKYSESDSNIARKRIIRIPKIYDHANYQFQCWSRCALYANLCDLEWLCCISALHVMLENCCRGRSRVIMRIWLRSVPDFCATEWVNPDRTLWEHWSYSSKSGEFWKICISGVWWCRTTDRNFEIILFQIISISRDQSIIKTQRWLFFFSDRMSTYCMEWNEVGSECFYICLITEALIHRSFFALATFFQVSLAKGFFSGWFLSGLVASFWFACG